MELAAVYKALGRKRSCDLVKGVSMGALRTFGVYGAIKIRSRLRTLNRRKLASIAPRLWDRIQDGDKGLERDLTQAVLVSNIPMIVSVLDLLGIEHDGNGFFDKDGDYTDKFSEGWEARVVEHCRARFNDDLVLLYVNHLGWEAGVLDSPYLGKPAAVGQTDGE